MQTFLRLPFNHELFNWSPVNHRSLNVNSTRGSRIEKFSDGTPPRKTIRLKGLPVLVQSEMLPRAYASLRHSSASLIGRVQSDLSVFFYFRGGVPSENFSDSSATNRIGAAGRIREG